LSLRPGSERDLSALRTLWAHEVLTHCRDCIPAETVISRMAEVLDWETRSRVIEDASGPSAVVVVLEHPGQNGTLVRVETAARDEGDRQRLIQWGVRASRSLGGAVAQVWRPKGHRQGMAELGLRLARPFWRMDRTDLDRVPEAPLPAGYGLAATADRRTLARVFNRSFAEHWRFKPLDAEGMRHASRPRGLDLVAVSGEGEPAAVAWAAVEQHTPDLRAQPVGLVEVVGTLPEHRRQGLAHALTAEALRRLRGHGARSASLYVDGLNPTRAYDVYAHLGFTVGFQYEVFEAVLV
jgi:ribosomal protein S18 acetylase RimI-like enzyme